MNYSFTALLQNSSCSPLSFPPIFEEWFFLAGRAGNYDATDSDSACLSIEPIINNGGDCVLVSQYVALCQEEDKFQ